MESYFIVKNEKLIAMVKEYESMREKIKNAFIEFAKEYEIETTEYYMFSIGDTVYGSFNADVCLNLPQDDFTELKASEFYKIIEDYEESCKKGNKI